MSRTLKTLVLLSSIAGLSLVWTGCAPKNSPPEIVGLACRQEVVAPLDSCLIECVAEDRDGDSLEYDWSSDSGTINGYAGTVAWTAPKDEGIFHVTVTVKDGGEEPPVSGTVTVIVKDNHYPAIDGFGADCDWVHPGENCAIRCQAEDMDGDVLTYTWSTDCGEVVGDGAVAVWTAPDFEANCTIRVVVSDGYGGERTASVALRSAVDPPLVVTDMVVTPVDEPEYLKFYDEGYKILKGRSCTIRCVVNEPTRIASYEWSDGGPVCLFPVGSERFVFEGGPSEIRWMAPMERGEYVIKVTARDAEGRFAEKSIVVKVETCTCAFSTSSTESEEPAE